MSKKVIIDFDHHTPSYRDDWDKKAEERATHCPVAWSEAHGGYWILSKHEDVAHAAANPDSFSSAHNSPDKPWAKGILIPELPYTLALSESDPPIHPARRMIEAPYFAPVAVRQLAEVAKRNVEEALDRVIHLGELDFAYDFAMRVAAKTTMELVGIDPERWEEFMLAAHKSSILPTDHPDYPINEIRNVQMKMRELLAERKQNPRKDIISALATKTAMGEPLTDEVQVGMLSAVVFGGFGTVMAATLNVLLWLEDNRELYSQLLADDALLDRVVEETLRLNPPNHGTARTVAHDMELHGQLLKKGDRILLSWAAANRDPAVFECPAEVRLDRPNGKDHFSFGGGEHRCLGAPLARVEIRLMVRAVINRMPDYKIDRDRLRYYPSFANTAGVSSMPATFTPTSRES
ncbi:cytochrome P450 [Pseudomonas sp. BN414]|uniref:cytochrome P450 n=1 Tax=Pseudomonas sp. BN414 TaxID=2567888 RepID=UPI0024553964|nr:cytochrome P450 [Pseudomonas sp. BN414]MDH4565175.1 cytochrome P450 [Pseudomonas sp. BN414]